MRLIDADRFLEFMEEKCDPTKQLDLIILAIVSEELKEQPTAYDIDKVVEELEKELENGNIAIDFGEFRLFEIVKNGGVSDDMCEWRMTDTKKLMPYKTSCGNEDLYDNSYKYCPYCGKKIKVVGD